MRHGSSFYRQRMSTHLSPTKLCYHWLQRFLKLSGARCSREAIQVPWGMSGGLLNGANCQPTLMYGYLQWLLANTWTKYGSRSAVNITNQHIKRDYYLVKEMVDDKIVEIWRAGSPSNLADIPSKAVSKEVIQTLGDTFCSYEKWGSKFQRQEQPRSYSGYLNGAGRIERPAGRCTAVQEVQCRTSTAGIQQTRAMDIRHIVQASQLRQRF